MTRIFVSLFGGPVVRKGKKSIGLSRFEASLVALVFGHGPRGLTRRRAADLLWGGDDGPERRHRLSQLLYKVAGKLEGAVLFETSGETLKAADSVPCDVEEFMDALRDDRLAEAGELMEAGFLPLLRTAPTEQFEQWREGKTLALRRALRERAATLWTDARPHENWHSAKAAAEAMMRLDPDDERVLRRLVLSRAMTGQVHEAHAAYRAFAERSEADGRVWRPEQQTLELLERVRTLESSHDGEPGLPIAKEPEAPLCGRDPELAHLRKLVSKPSPERPVCVLVSGEGGIGKTRLVEEAVVAATLGGVLTLRGRSSEFEREIPLNPLLEALNHPAVERALGRLEDPWRTVMLALMPQFHSGEGRLEDLGYIQPGSVPRRLFEAVHRLLLEVVEEQPVCLFIDDLHWADETSLTVLDFLRRRWTTGGLTMVFAVRPEILRPGTPWARFKSDLLAARPVECLELEELSDEAAEALVDAVGKPPLPRAMVREVCALSGQNPFFLIELTLEYLAGRFQPPDEITDEVPVPLSIVQVFEERLRALTSDGRVVGAALAVANESLTLSELSLISQLSHEQTLAAIEDLVRVRLVNCVKQTVELRHALIRESIYQMVSPARRATLHERVAQHVLSEREPTPIEALALHYHRAGSKNMALEYSLEAASRAEDSGAVAEAIQYLKIGRQNTEDLSVATEILGRLGKLHYMHGNFEEAAAALGTAAERWRAAGHDSAALLAETRRIDSLSRVQALPGRDYLDELGRIKESARTSGHWGVVAEALEVEVHLHDRTNDAASIREVFNEAHECVEHGDASAQCRAYQTLAINVYYGPSQFALDCARRAVAIASRGEAAERLPGALDRLLLVMGHLGLLESPEGVATLAAAEEAASASGDLAVHYNLRANKAAWHLETGDYHAALACLTRAAEVAAKLGAAWPRLTLALNRGEAYLGLRDFCTAQEVYGAAVRLLSPNVPSRTADLLHAGLGYCALELGELREARRHAEELRADPAQWYFNPSLIPIFRARMLARRREQRGAATLLAQSADKLSEGMVVGRLRLKLAEAKLRAPWDPERARRIAIWGAEVADSLGLGIRRQEFADILARLT